MHAGLGEQDFIHSPDGSWTPRDPERFAAAKADLVRLIGARDEAEYDALMRAEGPVFLTRFFTAP